MATVIVMPKLSPTMEEGVLLKWTKREGDKVAPGDVIAEVETDKANMEFPLEDEGTLLKQLVKEGDTVKLGAPVAVLGEPGESLEAAMQQVNVAPQQAVATTAGPEASKPQQPQKTGDGHAAQATTAPAHATQPATAPHAAPAATEGRVKASPLARKIAAEKGVDLHLVRGTGPGGRVVQRDVESAPAALQQARAATQHAPAAAQRGDETRPLSQMRKTIARRITEAKQTVPHFYLTMDAQCDALWAFHQQIKDSLGERGKVSINDLIVKATAVALTQVPAANASFSDGGLVRHGRVDVGVAVAMEDGLITPVVRDADLKTVGAIARETQDLIARARLKKLRPDEYTGATFSVSNLGMYGIREFSAIINPPESGILAVGALEKRPVVTTGAWGEDKLEIRRVMTLTLSCDHRVVDGALGAELLRAIVRILEKPAALVL